jgi:hypothetical protein
MDATTTTPAAAADGTRIHVGLGRQVGHFVRHLVEMCVAMCVGGGILNGLLFLAGPVLIGYPDLRQWFPELALLMIAVDYAVVMAVWMRLRGMAWRPTVEMSCATIGLAVVMVGLAVLGVVSGSSLRGWVFGFCGPACLVMIVVMLFRLDLYTGCTDHRSGHGGHAAQKG